MNKSTLIAIAVCAVLAGITIATWTEKPERGMTRISFAVAAPERATRIVVGGPSPIEVRKDGAAWVVGTKRADSAVVQQVLAAVARIESSHVVTRNPERFAELEVDGDEATHVQTFAGAAQAADFFIGTPGAGGGSHVRVGDTVYLVTGVHKSTFSRDRTAWLERKLFPETAAAATKVEVRLSGQPPYALAKDGQDWTLEDPSAFPAGYRFDGRAARALAAALVMARATDVLDADPGAEVSGLGETADVLTFHAGDVTRTLTLGATKEDGSVYARASTRDDIVTLPEHLAGNLRTTLAGLRDLTLMAFDTKDVTRLEIVRGKERLAFDRSDDTWKIAESTAEAPADFTLDAAAVVRRLSTVAGLRAVGEAETTAPAKTGLERPADRVALTLADGRALTLAFGADATSSGADAVYARGNADDRVYVVKPSVRDNVLGGIETFAKREDVNPLANIDPQALQNLPPDVRDSLLKQLAEQQQREQIIKALEAGQKSGAAAP